MNTIFKILSANWISHIFCSIRGYEEVQFWTMYLITSFAILILVDGFKDWR